MTPKQAKKLKRTLKLLRTRAPSKVPVRVRFNVKLPKPLWGETERLDKGFVIRLAPGPYAVVKETLVHEWAHVLSWPWTVKHFHNKAFGKAYSVAYCAGYEDT